MNNYEEFRKFSDKSIPETIDILQKFLYSYIKPSTIYDDMNKCIDLVFENEKVIFSHRCRPDSPYPIDDVTIKTESGSSYYIKDGKLYYPIVEFDKLCNYNSNDKFYYFYCNYNESLNKITKYIIYDIKSLISYDDFKNRKMFHWKKDQINTKDRGSKFNIIKLETIKKYNCLIVDNSIKIK